MKFLEPWEAMKAIYEDKEVQVRESPDHPWRTCNRNNWYFDLESEEEFRLKPKEPRTWPTLDDAITNVTIVHMREVIDDQKSL